MLEIAPYAIPRATSSASPRPDPALAVAVASQLPPSLEGQHHLERLTLPDGQQRWLSAQIRPVRDSEHTVSGFAAMVGDVTAVVDAYERRRAG